LPKLLAWSHVIVHFVGVLLIQQAAPFGTTMSRSVQSAHSRGGPEDSSACVAE